MNVKHKSRSTNNKASHTSSSDNDYHVENKNEGKGDGDGDGDDDNDNDNDNDNDDDNDDDDTSSVDWQAEMASIEQEVRYDKASALTGGAFFFNLFFQKMPRKEEVLALPIASVVLINHRKWV